MRNCSLIPKEMKDEMELELKAKETTKESDFLTLYSARLRENLPSLNYTPKRPRMDPFYQPSFHSTPRTPVYHNRSSNSPLSPLQIHNSGRPSTGLQPSHSAPSILPSRPLNPPANPHRQQEFGEDLTRMLSACGLAFHLVEQPSFRRFVQKWIPGVIVPSRETIQGPLLTKEADKVIEKVAKRVDGGLANYQCDGWKNVAKTSVVSSMIVVKNEPYLVSTLDMTGRPKTGDELYKLVKADLAYAVSTYNVDIILIVTDNGPDGRKMRRLAREDPNIRAATLECWAHQAGLMTGNYLAIKTSFMDATTKATEVIKWFNNHSKALDVLRARQKLVNGKSHALIMPVGTRWTSHFTTFVRLYSNRGTITGCVSDNYDYLLLAGGNKADVKAKAKEVLDICLDRTFWDNLHIIIRHIEFLAIAANIFQAPTCRLDHVLLTLANMYSFYSSLSTFDDDLNLVRTTMTASLERRWGSTDQELFILAVFFNPYVRAKYFNPNKLNCMDLFNIARRTFRRLHGSPIEQETAFFSALQHYYNYSDRFSSKAMYLDGFQAMHQQNGPSAKPIDLVEIWRTLQGPAQTLIGQGAFIQLAIRILSMVPNSASTESTFSTFGNTQTKLRNRLSMDKAHKATLVRMECRRENEALGLTRARQKRRFMAPGSPTENTTQAEPSRPRETLPSQLQDNESHVTFNGMAQNLIQQARDEDMLINNPDPPNFVPSEITPTPTSVQSSGSAASAAPLYCKITLSDLFDYYTPSSLDGLKFYWDIGQAYLREEEEVLDEVAAL